MKPRITRVLPAVRNVQAYTVERSGIRRSGINEANATVAHASVAAIRVRRAFTTKTP